MNDKPRMRALKRVARVGSPEFTKLYLCRYCNELPKAHVGKDGSCLFSPGTTFEAVGAPHYNRKLFMSWTEIITYYPSVLK